MATMITEECINCGACEPECPNTAIYQGGVEYDFNGAKIAAIANEIFYIVPDKCTECVGFHDHEACAAVCPVDCCVPDPDIPETHEVLLARAGVLHPDKTFAADSPSRFKKDGDGAAAAPPAAAAAAATPSAPVAAPAARPTAAPAAPAQVMRFGKVEKKLAAPLLRPPPRTSPFAGELGVDFQEALEIVSPPGSGAAGSRLLAVVIALAQPVLGALPAATKQKLEAAIGNPRVFSASGATGLNVFAHLLLLPILASVYATRVLGHSLYSYPVGIWFFYGGCAAVAEAIFRLREWIIGARPLSEVVFRGSIYGPLLLPVVAPIIARARGQHDAGRVAFEGYYDTGGAYDEKRERERRYGEIYSLEERPGGYLFRLEFPRRIPPSGLAKELGLGEEMPDYAYDLALGAGHFEVRGKVVDARLRTVAAVAPAFPPDFTTRVPLKEPAGGFVCRYQDKTLEVVIVKRSVVSRLPAPAHAA